MRWLGRGGSFDSGIQALNAEDAEERRGLLELGLSCGVRLSASGCRASEKDSPRGTQGFKGEAAFGFRLSAFGAEELMVGPDDIVPLLLR